MPVLLIKRRRPACYDISLSLSYAASFADWLLEAARAYDYRIVAAHE